VRPNALLRFDSTGLDPPEDGAVVHFHATIQQRQGEIAIAAREHQITAHRITSALNCRRLKD
jgi:hypothetical protein